jgi:hypothetical protein
MYTFAPHLHLDSDLLYSYNVSPQKRCRLIFFSEYNGGILYPLHPPVHSFCLLLRISANPITIIILNLSTVSYQAAFFTPGIFPASAFIRKLYCEDSRSATMISQAIPTLHCSKNTAHQITYSRHLEIPQHTPSFATFNTPISDLCRAGIAMHLRQLQLRLGARPRGQGKIADDVSKRLPIDPVSQQCCSTGPS